MPLPRPAPGMVVRYGYLWSREAEAGRVEGRKFRPCVIVVAATRQADGRIRVRVAPITHTPADPARGLRLPDRVKRHLGLDEDASWIVLDEYNEFVWPGPDLRPVSASRPGVWSYGVLPVEVFAEIKARLVALRAQRRVVRPE
jgi:hypothetical protein